MFFSLGIVRDIVPPIIRFWRLTPGLRRFSITYLEFGVGSVLLDLDRFGVLSTRRQQKVFDLLNLFRHLRAFLNT